MVYWRSRSRLKVTWYGHFCDFTKIASSPRQMAGSPPNLHMMVPSIACIQDVLNVKVKVKGYVIRILLWPNEHTEFHQTLVDDVVEMTDQLIRFWRSVGQGQTRYKVRREKLRTPYLLNGLKHHKPNEVKVNVIPRLNIWVSYCQARIQRGGGYGGWNPLPRKVYFCWCHEHHNGKYTRGDQNVLQLTVIESIFNEFGFFTAVA